MKPLNLHNMEKPCTKDCPDRNIWCHTTCERYIAFDKANKERLQAKSKQIEIDSALLDGRRRMADVHDKLKAYQGGRNK